MSCLNPFYCKIQIFKVRVEVLYFFLRNFENLQRFFTGEPCAGGHEHGVRRGISGVSFHLRTCPQGVASVLRKKTFIFGSRRSKLDHLTVHYSLLQRITVFYSKLRSFTANYVLLQRIAVFHTHIRSYTAIYGLLHQITQYKLLSMNDYCFLRKIDLLR